MQIKRINTSEYELVTSLFDKYRVFYKQPSDIKLAEKFITDRLQNNESVIFVALVDENGEPKPAGFTQLYPLISSVRAVKNWLLNDLYVDAAYRKQGIGEALIKAAADFAKADGARVLTLETAVDNFTAQKLYETIGFEKQDFSTDYFTYKLKLV
jgi:ribosomal protein S18 acetylase RimI-like enzyme